MTTTTATTTPTPQHQLQQEEQHRRQSEKEEEEEGRGEEEEGKRMRNNKQHHHFQKDLVLDLTFWFDPTCPGGLQTFLLMGSFIRGNHRGSGCRGPRCCSLGDKNVG